MCELLSWCFRSICHFLFTGRCAVSWLVKCLLALKKAHKVFIFVSCRSKFGMWVCSAGGYKMGEQNFLNHLSVHRYTMPRLSEAERKQAIGRLQAGESQTEVAAHFHVSQSTVRRLVARFQLSNSTADWPRSGRPRATTRAQDRFLRLRHLRDRFLPASSTVQALRNATRISDQTVRNRLRERGLRAYRPVLRTLMTHQHRQLRRQWANQHINWRLHNWRHVWFSDESNFLISRHDRRRRVYRRRNERFDAGCISQALSHGGGSVMVWGAISHTGRSNLVRVRGNLTAQAYINNILMPHALPLLQQPGAIFQHDNARPHAARLTREFLTRNNVQTLPWPSNSPDMNAIEHIWDALDRRLRNRVVAPATPDELFTALEEEWRAIPLHNIRRLIASMPRRCQAVLQSAGGHTRYWVAALWQVDSFIKSELSTVFRTNKYQWSILQNFSSFVYFNQKLCNVIQDYIWRPNLAMRFFFWRV